MKSCQDDFKEEFELIKKNTHEKLTKLFDKYRNAKDWKIDFKYDWCVPSSSSIDKDNNGWYDNIVEHDALHENTGVEND